MRDYIKKWMLNDYYTPSITAEVILDTLLTPYVPGIIRAQCGVQVGESVFVTKEMSILEAGGDSNRGAKIDYILAGDDSSEDTPVCLVELKTTDSSLKKDQAARYLKNCGDGCFGTVFGDHLLRIVQGAFGKTYKKEFVEKFGEEGPWNEQVLLEAFRLVFDAKPFQDRYHIPAPEPCPSSRKRTGRGPAPGSTCIRWDSFWTTSIQKARTASRAGSSGKSPSAWST